MSKRAATECPTTYTKHANETSKNAKRSAPDVNGMTKPHRSINTSTAMSKTRFTGTYPEVLCAARSLDVVRAASLFDFSSRATFFTLSAPTPGDKSAFFREAEESGSAILLPSSASPPASFARSLRGSAANAYACRFCTSNKSTGVVNTHSSWRKPEKDTSPFFAFGVAAPR